MLAADAHLDSPVLGHAFFRNAHGGTHYLEASDDGAEQFFWMGGHLHQLAVHVCFAAGNGEVDRVRLFIPDRRLGFGELVDAVLQLELFRQSAAAGPGDLVDRLAIQGGAGDAHLRAVDIGDATGETVFY